jgi:hypothetical protein
MATIHQRLTSYVHALQPLAHLFGTPSTSLPLPLSLSLPSAPSPPITSPLTLPLPSLIPNAASPSPPGKKKELLELRWWLKRPYRSE